MEISSTGLVASLKEIACSDSHLDLKRAALRLCDRLDLLPDNHPLFTTIGKPKAYILEELYRASNTYTFKWGIQFVLRLQRTISDYSRVAVAA